MKTLSLDGEWRLACYWRHQWRMRSLSPALSRPMLSDLPARVPGSIHADLQRAGLIPDPHHGASAFASEWIPQRDWSLRRQVTVPADFTGTLTLECDGLDYAGTVLIDGQEFASFEGTHLRHRFDLTGRVTPGQTFELEIIIDAAPVVDSQCGYTSRTRLLKPRFNYAWDWCTRVINLGIWQSVRLVARGEARLEHLRVLPRAADDLRTGVVTLAGELTGADASIRYQLTREEGTSVVEGRFDATGAFSHTFEVPDVALWWPATHGQQPLYRLVIEAIDARGQVSDRVERTIGFKRVRWLQNPGGPESAEPYLCEINGVPVFLRGANWVPLSPLYGSVTREQYERFLRLYRDMHANILRVWGGAILERPEFYETCDRLGILVWQEFPLSSSGLDDYPPEDPETIRTIERIAADWIERRAHHASHLLWCGGNELQKKITFDGQIESVPVDYSHPLIAALERVVERLDPGKRFLATSSTGPLFYAHAKNYGRGLHHDVHGPWANLPLEERNVYWNRDDSLFRSEVGAPGSAGLDALRRHAGQIRQANSPDAALWPPSPTNPEWTIPASAWAPLDDVTHAFGPLPDEPASLPDLVAASQYLQAESYRVAAEAARRAFPYRSGFIIWMGHDCVHNTSNNSVIEYDGTLKPAYHTLAHVWAPRHVSLRVDAVSFRPGETFQADVYVHDETVRTASSPPGSRVRVELCSLAGTCIEHLELPVRPGAENECVGQASWTLPELPERAFQVRLIWDIADPPVERNYVFSQQYAHPLAPLLPLLRRQSADA